MVCWRLIHCNQRFRIYALFHPAQDFTERIDRLGPADRAVPLDHERWGRAESICFGLVCGFLKAGDMDAPFKCHSQHHRIETHTFCNIQDNRSITDVLAVGEKRPKNGFMVGVMFSMVFRKFASLHRHARIAHQRLRTEPNAHFFATLIQLSEESFRIHSRKIIFPAYTLRWCVGMDFKWQPFINYGEFLFQLVDNTFADIAEGSDIVGIDGDLHWIHPALLCNVCSLPLHPYYV